MPLRPLVEPLYYDRRRLAEYAEQATGTPFESTRVNKLGGELSVTPKLTAEVTEERRERTTREQMDVVERHLRKTGELQETRPITDTDFSPFVLERCHGRRVSVPTQGPEEGGTPAFAFWLCPPDVGQGMLCLLEEFGPKDEAPTSFHGASTYTLLQSLVHFTRSKLRATILSEVIPDERHPNPYASFEGKPPSLSEYHNVQPFCYEFVTDPFPMLERWGCRVSSDRRIRTLYRIREIGRESAHSFQRATVFAYPIWILSER
jgi:hypothetical protein